MQHGKIALLLCSFLLIAPASASELSIEQRLGRQLFNDINLSINHNQSCQSCHSLARIKVPTEVKPGVFQLRQQASPGFVDTANVRNGSALAHGSLNRALGKLNPPSIGYAAFSPEFHWDGELFIGGHFWNGRAANLMEQAKEPLLNPLEMAMPDAWAVVARLKNNKKYVLLFRYLYGIKLKQIKRGDGEVEDAFNAMAHAIASFERTALFNRFDSKFDYEAAGITTYSAAEQRGADLFDDAAQCSLCHSTEGIDGDNSPALLTDFSYDNLGVPPNPQIPGNPAFDPGLQGNPNLEALRGEPSSSGEVEGRHKVMSLRNIALTPPYMHNGVFKTLEEVVHFYNTRDVLPQCSEPVDATHPGFGQTCWPRGEFHSTRNTEELGDLGLTQEDEADLVAYLKTFSDNYPLWGNSYGLKDPHVPKRSPSPFAGFPVPQLP
ncbi:MAG: methylamine utilization protein MauG [Gammaproteobacteria bacterium]|nr:methylamine utilization protein MauG [Gammaproteobacteria bacterium]MBQ0838912.1 methylamine utilization protein MauG [Gammaproteobacteria bacterium]